jgi:hypothetical protein
MIDADGLWRVQLIPENELANLLGADFMMVYSAAAPITLRELRTDESGARQSQYLAARSRTR